MCWLTSSDIYDIYCVCHMPKSYGINITYEPLVIRIPLHLCVICGTFYSIQSSLVYLTSLTRNWYCADNLLTVWRGPAMDNTHESVTHYPCPICTCTPSTQQEEESLLGSVCTSNACSETSLTLSFSSCSDKQRTIVFVETDKTCHTKLQASFEPLHQNFFFTGKKKP